MTRSLISPSANVSRYRLTVNPHTDTHCRMRVTGAKSHKTSELLRVVEKSGKSYTVKGEVGLSGLSAESRMYAELSDEGHRVCLSLEAAIEVEERTTQKGPFFPIIIGR